MDDLLRHLSSIPVGHYPGGEIEYFLSRCWDQFTVDDEGMDSYKLLGRMEDIYWNPPILTFVIERHGGTVLGSTRAELQTWKLNMDTRKATCVKKGYRQIHPRQAKLDVKPVAEEIARLIIDRREDERIRWNKDGSVRIQIGKVLPQGSVVKETLVGRRKRLRKAIDERLSKAGWKKVRENVYAP